MASIQKREHANGSITYRTRVCITSYPLQTALFRTRKKAKAWAQKIEAGIREGMHFPRQEGKERTL